MGYVKQGEFEEIQSWFNTQKINQFKSTSGHNGITRTRFYPVA